MRLGTINKETLFVLNYLGRDEPELVSTLPIGSIVVLTDHNEKQQSLDNIDDVKVVSIIDHHHFRYTTTEPIEIIVKPIASTCSVIYGIRKASGKPMPQDIARGLMAGLISDSLYFRSPTTTQADRDIFEDMKQIANITDTEQFSLDMFTAKSDLGNISTRDLITLDYKTFKAGEELFGIGSVETINPSYTLNRKDEIIPELLKYKKEL
ncbi:MAG: DHHA2 domain-containing protein [bacterium]